MKDDKILILDFGGQYTQLIAKAIRSLHVYSEIISGEISVDALKKLSPKGIIFSGGPESVHISGAPLVEVELLFSGIPVLGICYGMQMINFLLGGDNLLEGEFLKEYGETEIEVNKDSLLFSGLPKRLKSWMSHGDSVDQNRLGKGLFEIACSEHHVAAIEHKDHLIFGVQFHPEVAHMPEGKDILKRFIFDVCRCQGTWKMEHFITDAILDIRKSVGDKEVISFVSGGIDSTFVTVLLAKALSSVHAVYIEALMRKGETEEVEKILFKAGVKNLTVFKAEDEFIKALEGVQDPEEKRKIIGNLFVTFQKKACDKLGLDLKKTVLAQGTLYTDLIESGSGVGSKAKVIKSHHNVGCHFIEELKKEGRVIEPNKYIFKDEVREAAKEIGLPSSIYKRQPFPGPGLGIRIVDGDPIWINSEFYRVDAKVKKIAGHYGMQGWVCPIKSVGVQGDSRTYSFVAMIKGEERDWKRARELASALTMEIVEVNRVVLNIDPTPIEATHFDCLIATPISVESVSLLQELDFEGRELIVKENLPCEISQTIFVLCGLDIYCNGKRLVVLRAVMTDDFMTLIPCRLDNVVVNDTSLTWECLDTIRKKMIQNQGVGTLVYDITDKPPATTEWE
jgi:GMP synthase (glutamine-hydrolysing)